MRTLLDDLRFSLRLLFEGGVTSALAILTLAIGIGANTAMFTFIDVMIFRPANAGQPEELAWLTKGIRGNDGPLSLPHVKFAQANVPALAGVAAWAGVDLAIGGGVSPVRAHGSLVTGNYFDVLRVRPLLGRTFTADEDSLPGERPVVVLSHAFWMKRFKGDSSVLQRPMIVNGRQFTVVGVMRPGFSGIPLASDVECWVPLAMLGVLLPSQAKWATAKDMNWLVTVARLAPGVPLEQARASVRTASVAINADSVKPAERELLSLQPAIGSVQLPNRQEAETGALLLALVPLLVLLVACANAANMQLAQGIARSREFAVRQALGASRSRLIRQLLTESILLAAIAGAVGVLLAYWFTRIFVRLGSVPAFIADGMTPSAAVLWTTVGVAGLAGVIFGLAPALTATNPSLTPALKDDGPVFGTGRGGRRLRDTLVIGQIAVATVLLVVAGLFLRSLDKATRVDPGFDVAQLNTVSFDVGTLGYSEVARASFAINALERVRAIPGVSSAALSTSVPFGGSLYMTNVEPVEATSEVKGLAARFSSVGTGYFETLELPLLRGRDFTNADNASSTPVVIVSDLLAQQLWPGVDPIGKRMRFTGDSTSVSEVIGVARSAVHQSLAETPIGFVYQAMAQSQPGFGGVSMIWRSTGPAGPMQARLREVFRELDSNLPLDDLRSYDVLLRESTESQRVVASGLGLFGAIALLLAALGMYGVTAHGVTLRTREIGIRMSLGARKQEILEQFLREGMRRSVIGIAIGFVLSLGASRLLGSFLFGLGAMDVVTFLLTAAVLCSVAAIATLLPARRAASVDPRVAFTAQ
jgi:putative ABC transport system permease protein